MQARQGARGFSTGAYFCVREQEKRSATPYCDADMRLQGNIARIKHGAVLTYARTFAVR